MEAAVNCATLRKAAVDWARLRTAAVDRATLMEAVIAWARLRKAAVDCTNANAEGG